MMQRLRVKARSHGICTRCFERVAAKGRVQCQECGGRSKATWNHDRYVDRREEDDAAGMCVRCHKNEQQPTNKRCVECEAYHQKHKKATPKRRPPIMPYDSYALRSKTSGDTPNC